MWVKCTSCGDRCQVKRVHGVPLSAYRCLVCGGRVQRTSYGARLEPQPTSAVFTHCNVCGIRLSAHEDAMGMCERCARE
jgi:hypothetical protein